MQELKEHKAQGSLHHAYLVHTNQEDIITLLCEVLGIDQVHPNVFVRTYDTCSIDVVRGIQQAAHVRPVSGEDKYIILSFQFATVEAQNALLKVLEEPTPSTHFFVVTPYGHLLLDTVRSRLYALNTNTTAVPSKLIQEFLRVSYAERLEFVKKFIDEKDKGGALNFLNQLESELHEKRGAIKELSEAFAIIQRVRRFLELRSPSLKLALEYLVLSLPADQSFAREQSF